MTPDQARDEMFAVFKAAWDTTALAVTYTDVPGSVPQAEEGWARLVLRHATGNQRGFGATNVRKYTQTGVLVVQVFAPIGDGSTKAYELAQLVLAAYRQARGGSVWYRDTYIKEIGCEGAFEQINVLINFTYDDER